MGRSLSGFGYARRFGGRFVTRWDPPFFPSREQPEPPPADEPPEEVLEEAPPAMEASPPEEEPSASEPEPEEEAVAPEPDLDLGEARPDLGRSNVLKVRNRTWGLWAFGWLGAPMIFYGAGVLFGLQPFGLLVELLYPGESRNPPGIETRDRLWGWMLLIIGTLLLVGMLWRLLVSHPALEVDAMGIRLPVNGPGFSRRILWDWVDEIYADDYVHETDRYPVLCLRMNERARIPSHPWAVRVGEDGVLAIPAGEWDISLPFVVQWLQRASQGLATGESPTRSP